MIETVDVVHEPLRNIAVILSLSPVAVQLSPVLDSEDLVLLLVSAEVAVKDEDYCFDKYHVFVQLFLMLHLSPVAVYLSPVAEYLSPVAVYLSPVAVYLSPVAVYFSPVAVYLSPAAVYLSPVAVVCSYVFNLISFQTYFT